MASIAITFQSVCAGGCHLFVGASIDGGATQNLRLDRNDLLTQLTAAEAPDILTNLLRIHMRGKTPAQAKADLQAGITMTV